MVSFNARRFLRALFDSAVSVAQPARCIAQHFPDPPANGKIIVIACGKAAAGMARAAELHYEGENALQLLKGIAVTRYGFGQPLSTLRLIEASHPVPDEKSVYAADEAIALAQSAGPEDLVLCLLSGGASALCAAPSGGIALAEKQELTRTLLKAGARIHEINCVRKHISRFKGGRLASYASAATLVTLAISDTPGDEPETVGSGPTCPDPTTLAEAGAIISRYGIKLPAAVEAALNDPSNETPKPGDPAFDSARYEFVATGRDSLDAAGELARSLGYDVIMLGDSLEGEAREVAQSHAQLAKRCLADGRRAVILSGGELTVTVTGSGCGGPNQEYALALAIALNGEPGIAALAGDTDGADGGTGSADDPAGAIIDPGTIGRAVAFNLVPATFLSNNDATGLFRLTNDLLVCGPTGTNVNDFRAIVVDSSIRD
ncbi:MAG: glycerate kinase [Rhodomicrobium sp.]|nr:glycerate kinase [Rhodomicrobium sp.]